MLWYIAALVAILAGSRATEHHQETNKQQNEQPPQQEQHQQQAIPQQGPLPYYGGFQGHQLPLQYDVRFLVEPSQVHQQIPNLGFASEKQIYPRVQPQLLFYSGGAPPGQPFLLQPGTPPGNFLIPQPQPGPDFVLRDSPQRPLFIAGYPKPAHVPPVEKDAEEIPTDPAKIPKFPSNKKPEKLETFNESGDREEIDEGEVLASPEKNPNFYPKKAVANLKPGQRFFVLNGQNLFPAYPFPSFNAIPHGIEPLKYEQAPPHQEFLPQQQIPTFDQQYPYFLRNPVHYTQNEQFQGQNVAALHQPQSAPFAHQPQEGFPGFPFSSGTGELPLQKLEAKQNDKNTEGNTPLNENYDSQYLVGGSISKVPLRYYQYETSALTPENDDSVVVDAKQQNSEKKHASTKASHSGNSPAEPSISQAQPGAIALAGPGGVAASAPRGTALVGNGGLAISSPQATAVAGPTREEQSPQKKNKNNRKP